MKYPKRLILSLLSLLVIVPFGHGAQSEQTTLDAACEAARQIQIEKDKVFLVQECVDKKFKSSRADCERFYADHGNQAGSRAALYYDLPECVEAFEATKNQRRR